MTSSWWPLIKVLPVQTHFHFVRLARLFAALSVIACIASIVLCFYPGLKRGIDFKGGTVLELSTGSRPMDLAKVRETVGSLNLGDVQVQGFATPADPKGLSNASVRFQTPDGSDPAQTVTKVKNALAGAVGNPTFTRSDVVGPKVSGELFQSGLLALLLSIGLMLVYIWFRFELQFGLGAVVALFHDVILVFGLIALFRFEFSLNTVAAILTVIGYSMNDTVVVFDRIRENLRKYKKMPLGELIDLSINETLTRTVITGVTALMALGGLAVFGGEALRGFSLVLMFGIAIGTYSSIYVASPTILLWGVKRGEDAEVLKPQPARP
ncbi:MAG: protein translocase subunit SecF [Caulobacteraceae bacterium]